MDCAKCRSDCAGKSNCLKEKCPNCSAGTMGICANQSQFNTTIKDAMKYNMQESQPGNVVAVIIGTIWLVILFWALILVSRLPPGINKKEHYLFAFLVSPVYVFAHYLDKLA